jgi:hypothetical protein
VRSILADDMQAAADLYASMQIRRSKPRRDFRAGERLLQLRDREAGEASYGVRSRSLTPSARPTTSDVPKLLRF